MSTPKSGTSAGVAQVISTGAHRSPYRSGWYTSRSWDGASSVAPSSMNTSPVALATRFTAAAIIFAPRGGALSGRTT